MEEREREREREKYSRTMTSRSVSVQPIFTMRPLSHYKVSKMRRRGEGGEEIEGVGNTTYTYHCLRQTLACSSVDVKSGVHILFL
jgi:hypothetical protein